MPRPARSLGRAVHAGFSWRRLSLLPACGEKGQADEGRVTANANVSAYGFDPKDPSPSLATAGNTDAATPE
ncbi:hypothetical protein ACVMB3_002375 [Sinorhizobium meliloti]